MKQWVINRVGLLNFWYYQNQIFEFSEGKMLFRGTNGSGKSLTMQSLFPVLFDGDTRAARLDSFGSQDRKMIDYLLGEKGVSDRDEGIGYLFLEVKRQDREEYLTVGIGMSGKRGGTLTKWFFAIENNQRIGIDFELYEEPRKNEIIPNTKRKLTNRLVDIGRVFESQQAYKQFVNERIFGFEDIEQFEELITLLINLRSPKLSKEFKPTSIYGILHDSLPKLKDDELLTLSKTIEQLDGHRDRLEDLGNEIKELKKFTNLYRRFKQEHDGQIAGKWLNMHQEVEQLIRENHKKARLIEQEQEAFEAVGQAITENQNQLQAIAQSIQELNQHEGMDLVQRGQELQEQLASLQMQFSKNQALLQRKEERLKENKVSLEQGEVKLEAYFESLEDYLADNEQYLTYLRLEELDGTYSQKMRTSISEEDYAYWKQEVQRKKNKLETIREELRKYDDQKERVVLLAREVADLQQQVDESERDIRQWQQTRQAEVERWKQAFEQWREQASFSLDAENARELLYRMDQLLEEEIREELVSEPVRRSYDEARESNHKSWLYFDTQQSQLLEQQARKQEEVREWENQKMPVPFRTKARQENREQLGNESSYIPFYESIDFIKGVSEKEQQRIEGALYASGLLDALIYPEGLHLASDQRILPTPVYFGQTLADYLKVNEETPKELQPIVADVIQSILYDESSEEHATIYADGTYKMANIEGAMPKDYQVAYIGSTSQAQYRQQKMAQLQVEITQLADEITTLEEEKAKVTQVGEKMASDYRAFPNGNEVYQSIKFLKGLDLEWQSQMKDKTRKEKELDDKEQALLFLQSTIHEQALEHGLPLTQAAYQEAIVYARNYEENLSDAYRSYSSHSVQKTVVATLSEEVLLLEEEIQSRMMEGFDQSAEITKQERLVEENLKQQKVVNVEELQQQLAAAKEEQKARQTKVSQLRDEQLELIERLATNRSQWQVKQEIQEEKQFKETYWKQLCEKRFSSDLFLEEVKEAALVEDSVKLRERSDDVLRQFNFIVDQLGNYQPKILNNIDLELSEEVEQQLGSFSQYNHYKEPVFVAENQNHSTFELLEKLVNQQMILRDLSKKEDEDLFKTIILESVGKVLRSRIQQSMNWVGKMDQLLKNRKNSSGFTLSIQWKPRTGQTEHDLGTAKLVELLQKPIEILSEIDRTAIAQHFQEKVYYAQEMMAGGEDEQTTLFQAITEALDYRNWFDFEMKYKRANEGYSPQTLTDRKFNQFSGGEKALSMYLPLFAAVYSRYLDAEEWSPRMITLDEAFAGIDDINISDLFAVCEELGFNYVMNSQALFGDYPTVSNLMIYELLRPQNMNLVTPICYHWDGKTRKILTGVANE